MKRLATFAFLWLLVGFTTGTATLLGPVRWLTNHARASGWSAGSEDLAVRGAIGLFIVLSAAVSLWLTRTFLSSARFDVRGAIAGLGLVCAGATLWLWLSPERMGASMGPESRVGQSFTFGAYATEERMRELKGRGYTAVVSLLHPIVAPFETKLILDGKAAAERVGIDYIHVPMLPWVGDNGESLERIEELARNAGDGRYYVHCYLGKDRVRLVQRLVARITGQDAVGSTAALAAHAGRRSLSDKHELERGGVIHAADGVYVIPYPTDDEFMSYVLPGINGPVISLLDPDNAEDRHWIDRERKLLDDYAVEFRLRPVPHDDYDAHRVLEVAREAAAMPRPMIVHGFLAGDSGRSPAVEAFVQAFRANLPPLPPSLFTEPMGGAQVDVLAPNVAAGPRPGRLDFDGYLRRKGIREFVYVGDENSADAREDRAACKAAGLPWRVLRHESELDLLEVGGPWYVYGPELAGIRDWIETRLGPPLPDGMRWIPPGAAAKPAAPTREPEAVAAPRPRDLAGFVRAAIPDVKTVILLGPVLLLFAGAAAAFAGWLRSAREVRAPYTRKIFHFCIFTLAGALHVAGGLPLVALFGGIVSSLVLYAVFRGDGFGFYEAMARPTDAPRRTLFIVIPLITTALGGLASNFLFGAFAFVGYLVAGWGDAIAEPVGTAWGRHRYRVPSLAGVMATRSLEGSTAVLLVGGLAAFFGLYLSGTPAPTALAAACACGVAGATVEAFSNHGLDNLTVQVAAAGMAWYLLA